MDDLLRRPKSIRILRALRKHGPMSMKDFEYHAKLSWRPAQELREWMESIGLLVVKKAEPEEPVWGSAGLDIRLTPHGEQIADKLFEIDPILARARKSASREDPR